MQLLGAKPISKGFTTKLKGALKLLSWASKFGELPMRPGATDCWLCGLRSGISCL